MSFVIKRPVVVVTYISFEAYRAYKALGIKVAVIAPNTKYPN